MSEPVAPLFAPEPAPSRRSPARPDRHRLRAAAISAAVRADLHRRRWLRLHAVLIGLTSWLLTWALSHALMTAGVHGIALRLSLALAGGYLMYLGLLRLWCRWLLSRDDDVMSDGGMGDVPLDGLGQARAAPGFRSGQGGDFGGGGAQASFSGSRDADIEAGADAPGAGWDGATELAGRIAEGGLGAADADEGAVVVVPLALVVAAGVLLGVTLGAAVFGLFGVEILLGVAVEIALASAGTVLAYKAQAEGWLAFALRRTIKPFLVCLLACVLLGGLVDVWLPQARSLPHAVMLWRGASHR